MKKLTSIILAIALCFSLTASAIAQDTVLILDSRIPPLSSFGIKEYDSEEVFLTQEKDSFGNTVVLSYIKNANGGISMFSYENGKLTEMTYFVPGNTYYEYANKEDITTRTSALWKRIDFSDNVTHGIRNKSGPNIRDLGYIYYRNSITSDLSIVSCYIKEWFNADRTVTLSGSLGTLIQFATFIVSALGIPVALSTGVASALLYAGAVTAVGNGLVALVSVDVTANVTTQEIYGECTTDVSKPVGRLDGEMVYVSTDSDNFPGEMFYTGITTHSWGTGEMGRLMAYEIFGVELTPTSWYP